MKPHVCDSHSGLLRLDAAVERLLRQIHPITEQERLPIGQALGRVLASDIRSPLDLPSFTNSAMDGYAVRLTEAQPGARLRVVGTSLAGQPSRDNVDTGDCVRIFTGACLPQGTDAVVVQEEVECQGSEIVLKIQAPPRQGENVRLQGEELKAGDRLLSGGQILKPAGIGLLAMTGFREVDVIRKPRVAFIATGDELVQPGQHLEPGCIYDSNRPVLTALCQQLGLETLDLGVIRDDRAALTAALESAARQADALITMGGASVGEADFMVEVLRELGTVEFWKVAIKPGKPFLNGRIGDTPVFGLPGNPVSMMVTFLQLARPALQRRMGMRVGRPVRWPARCQTRITKSAGRLEFQRGILDWQGGSACVTPLRGQGSHVLTSMSRANCFIVLPEECTHVEEGDTVEIEPFDSGFVNPDPGWLAPGIEI
jgi:molybdopterin molybdotransferase